MAGFTTQSAIVRNCIIEVLSACSPIKRISPMILDCGASTGVIPVGRELPKATIFSLTICRAWKISIPQLNSAQTNEKPYMDAERTRLTLVAPFTAVSIGNVTRRSTSSAAIPCASVITTTVGAVRSGKTSISIRWDEYVPATISNTAPINTNSLLLREYLMILFIKFIIGSPYL